MFATAATLLALLFLPPDPLANAVSLYESGQYRKAADILRLIASDNSNSGDAQLWLGKTYLRLRQWDDAVRRLEAAVAVQPDNGVYHLWLGRAYGEKASRASIFRAYGLARKVVAEFEAAVRMSPENMDARFDLLQFYLEAPGMVGGGKNKAEAQIRAIAERNPRLGRTARAVMYEQDKNWDQCRGELVKSTEEFPKEAGAFTDLADFLLRRKEFGGAESAAGTAVKLDPAKKKASFLLAASRVGLGKEVAQAEGVLKKLASGPLADDDPSFSDVYFWLGRAYSAHGKSALAREAFERALSFDPEHAAAKSALAGIS